MVSYAETRDAAMAQTLAAINDVAEAKCGHCNEPLPEDGPSQHWCDDWCQAKWMNTQVDNPADVYSREDYYGEDDDDELFEAYRQRWIMPPSIPSLIEGLRERQQYRQERMQQQAEQAMRQWEAAFRMMRETFNAPAEDFEAYRQVTIQHPRQNGRSSAFARLMVEGFRPPVPDGPDEIEARIYITAPTVHGERIRAWLVARAMEGNPLPWRTELLNTMLRDPVGEPWREVLRPVLGAAVDMVRAVQTMTARERALQARQNRNTGPQVRRRNPRRIDPRGTQ